MAASDSPTTVQLSRLRCLFIDSALPDAFDLDQKLKQNVAQVILVAFYFDEKNIHKALHK